jgi:hypothetical protein
MGRIAPLAAALCIALAAGCDGQHAAAPAGQTSEPSARRQLPVANPPLDREALLLEVVRAASAAATGMDRAEEDRQLDGKQFELRLRFGCPGDPTGGDESRNWSLDEAQRVLRIEIKPELVSDAPLVKDILDSAFEAAEGFWIRRPWLLQAACLRSQAAPPESGGEADAETPATPTPDAPPVRLGLVQFFTSDEGRTHRRGNRPYQATESLAVGEQPSSAGYDLVIRGRLQSLPDGRVIACTSSGSGQPSCIVSARFEEVSLERADTAELLAEWPSG